MEAICPKCLSQQEHSEESREVVCQVCGTQFDPEQSGNDLPPLDMVFSAEENSAKEMDVSALKTPLTEVSSPEEEDFAEVALPAIENSVDEVDSEGLPPVDLNQGPHSLDAEEKEGGSFNKSEEVFEEIRTFGEALLEGDPDEEKTKPTANSAKVPSKKSVSDEDTIAMSSAAAIEGKKIVHYCTPVSLSAPVEPEAEEPLKEAFKKFELKVRQTGANAVVDMKWSLTADGAKVIIAGTPVKCSKG